MQMFRDFGLARLVGPDHPKSRNNGGGFLSNVTAATPRSLAPKKLPSFGNKIPETPGVGFLQMFRDFGLARLVGPDHPKSRNNGGGFLSNVTAATPRSLAPKKLPSFGNKIPETPGVGFLQMFRDFGLARLVGPDHPKSRNNGGVGFFPM